MNKLYNNTGFFSEEGLHSVHPLKMTLYKMLNMDENLKALDEDQLRTLGGSLQKMVADAISERIQFKREVSRQLEEMNDAQLEGLLKAKYGPRWMYQTLTPEELQRVANRSKE